MDGDTSKQNWFIITCMICIGPGAAFSTTWWPTRVADPVTQEGISVQIYGSYGSYIYNWPSKFDLVFWPYTDEEWIWLNPKSGYGAFANDFNDVSAEQAAHLKQWLKANYSQHEAPQSHQEKLIWLEAVYHQRQMDAEFWCHFNRLMAYMFKHDRQISLSYVQKTMPLLQGKLRADPNGFERIQVLYLLGEYSRRLGDKSNSKDFFKQAESATYQDEEGRLQQGHPYTNSLIQEIRVVRRRVHIAFGLLCLVNVLLTTIALLIHFLRKRRWVSQMPVIAIAMK